MMRKVIIIIFIFLTVFIYGEEYIKVNLKSNIKGINIEINEYLNTDKSKMKNYKYEGGELVVELIKSKPYKLTVNENGYEKYEYYFTADGEDVSVILMEKINNYTVKLTSNKKPDVYIDGMKVGKIPMEIELEEGKYNFKFVTLEDMPKSMYVEVNKDETIFVKFKSDEENNQHGYSN